MPLVAHYPLTEDSGTTAYDHSGHGNDGTISGVTMGTSGGPMGQTVGSFDGVDDHVDILTTGFSRFSIFGWIKGGNTQSDSYSTLFGPATQQWATGTIQVFVRNSDDVLYVDAYDLSSSAITGSQDILTNEWTHIGATYDGSTLTGWVNGVEEMSTSSTGTTTSIQHSIGAVNSGTVQRLTGSVADVRVYDHALSPIEVSYLASAPDYATAATPTKVA